MSVSSSLDKDQIKVVIHEVTRWLDLAEEGDWMTLPGITGRQEPAPPTGERGGRSPSHTRRQGDLLLPSPGPGHRFGRRAVLLRQSPDLNSEVEGFLTYSEF